MDAVVVEDGVDVVCEIRPNRRRGRGDSGRPLFNQAFDILQTVIARAFKVARKLPGCESGSIERLRTDSPYGGNPGKVGACLPLAGEVEPLARANGSFDLFAALQSE